MNALFTGVTGIKRSGSGHKVIHTFSEKNLYPVVASTRLLTSMMRRKAIQETKEAAAIPDEYYDSLYKELINNFASFVQILPVNNEARLGSLLDEGLMRGLFALQIQQKAAKGDIDPVMSYVIFSAALLFDIGCVIENRTVIISEEDGSFVKMWDPYHDGSMVVGSYYRIRHGGGVTPWSSRRSVIALACKLMPSIGFDWIYKNPHAFNIWLALLIDDKEGAGSLRLYFERAREMLEEFKTSPDFFVPVEIEEIEPQETENAEDFIAWLKEALENGNIPANAANGQVFNIEGDKLFFTNELFKRYAASKNSKVNWQDVVEELKKLGFTSGEEVSYFYAQQRAAAMMNNAKAHAFSASSLFGGGGRSGSEQQHAVVTEQVTQNTAVETTTSVVAEETKVEKIMAAGGRVDGYVINMAQGFVVPSASYPINIVPAVAQQALANQLPQASNAEQQRLVQEARLVAQDTARVSR
jgi:hypothetical protein